MHGLLFVAGDFTRLMIILREDHSLIVTSDSPRRQAIAHKMVGAHGGLAPSLSQITGIIQKYARLPIRIEGLFRLCPDDHSLGIDII